MFVTIVLVLCLQNAPICREEIGTDSDRTPGLTLFDCHHSQAAIAQWKNESRDYHKDVWRVDRVKCVPGHYEIQGRA